MFEREQGSFKLLVIGSVGIILVVLHKVLKYGIRQLDRETSTSKIFAFLVSLFASLILSFAVGFSANIGTFGWKVAASILTAVLLILSSVFDTFTKLDQLSYVFYNFGLTLLFILAVFDKSPMSIPLLIAGFVGVMIAEKYIFPYQRKKKIPDGPGYLVYIFSWFLFVFANANLDDDVEAIYEETYNNIVT